MTPRALRFAVIGSPVAHSKSPRMHMAAFRALGMLHTYEKVETTAAELEQRVEELRRGDFAGLNVTVPHKQRVLALVDDVHASARATGAANTLVRTADGRIRAHNTDMPALAAELSQLAGDAARLRGGVGVVIGTGGAARAAIVALASHLGLGRVLVRGRSLGETSNAIAYVREIDRVLAAAGGRGVAVALGADGLLPPAKEDAKLVAIIQATSCGMTGAAPGEVVANAVRWQDVPSGAVAYDVVYAPPETPFLAMARAHGLACANGLGMLARQGALAFELWLGVEPPLDVMIRALHDA
ncbi:MAG: shikimate dehydrogenase [Deltaproteobacteria bacterium]|nr:shikimate dehydrogenase [Deltaproteobacteria bacterium]